MIPEEYASLVFDFRPVGDVAALQALGPRLRAEGHTAEAAACYDRAFGLDPENPLIREPRQEFLDQLAVVEHGMVFRYIPAGTFLMGSRHGDADERPVHPVRLSAFWLAETPMSWTKYCELMGWQPPPRGLPERSENTSGTFDREMFALHQLCKIRLQYCEDKTTRAVDWHTHALAATPKEGVAPGTPDPMFGAPPRTDARAPHRYDSKPLVAVAWREAEELGAALSGNGIRYGLPTEAQWERAARGGRIGQRYPWGDDPLPVRMADYDRFQQFSLLPAKTLPPNDLGLYAICGGVWEWTRDWYDRDFYCISPMIDPEGPEKGEERVLRGGCWADCPEAATVSFRMSMKPGTWPDRSRDLMPCPNIGFRLCRWEMPASD